MAVDKVKKSLMHIWHLKLKMAIQCQPFYGSLFFASSVALYWLLEVISFEKIN